MKKETMFDLIWGLGILIIFLSMIIVPIILEIPYEYQTPLLNGLLYILVAWILGGFAFRKLKFKKKS